MVQSALKALCVQFPKVRNWNNLSNEMLYQIELTRIESVEKGLLYLPREIEEEVNNRLKAHYSKEIERSIAHYVENGIDYLNETLCCQYGVLDTILLSY